MEFKTVTTSKRLYAFAIDIGVVAIIKITILQALTQYLQGILLGVGKTHLIHQMESQLTVFFFTLFPITWMAYSFVSNYLFGSTIGTKAMGYHFEQIHHHKREELSLLQAFQRSAILLATIYTGGAISIFTLFAKNKKIILTDIIDNVSAVYNSNEFVEQSLLPVPVTLNEQHFHIDHNETSEKKEAA